MGYTSPVATKAVGDPGLAADWNTYVRDNLAAMVDWTSYTPALTQGAAVAKTTTYAKYRKFGTTCHVVGKLTTTAAGTTGSTVVVGLPSGATSATSTDLVIGTGLMSISGTVYPTVSVVSTTTTIAFYRTDTNPAAQLGGDPSAALNLGAIVRWEIEYETT